MTDSATYLDRRAAREAALALKRRIVFGYGLGGGLFFLGVINGYLIVETRHAFWHVVAWMGALALLATVALPSLWSLPERGWRRLSGKIGHGLFVGVLSITYYLLVWPAGCWLRRREGRAPFWEWTDSPPGSQRWEDKLCRTITHQGASRRERLRLFQPFSVIGFFIRHRNYVLVPTVVLLIVLGLVLFFVQTSVLAPFIYTLF